MLHVRKGKVSVYSEGMHDGYYCSADTKIDLLRNKTYNVLIGQLCLHLVKSSGNRSSSVTSSA